MKKTNYRRIIVKVGSKVLTLKGNKLEREEVQLLVRQISGLVRDGTEVILVSSGAIAEGMNVLGIKSRPSSLPLLQAAAAVGQNQLMKIYQHYFQKEGINIGQILLTQDDLSSRKRYLNAKNTLLSLLEKGVVPVINENDSVATDEIKFGDNDKLSALVANLIGADCLVILSDVDGLYHSRNNKKSKIDVVEKIDRNIEKMAYDSAESVSVGGMKTKIEAAKIVTSSGIPCLIANGRNAGILSKIVRGENVGTIFLPAKDQLKERKKWIAFSARLKGKITVDRGAERAIKEMGRSLLSAGIVKINGNFAYGDMVKIADENNREFARGLVNYSSGDLAKIKGLKTNMIEKKLGYKYYDEVIHRDNLVVLK
jgi:glutamate 5-kinase